MLAPWGHAETANPALLAMYRRVRLSGLDHLTHFGQSPMHPPFSRLHQDAWNLAMLSVSLAVNRLRLLAKSML